MTLYLRASGDPIMPPPHADFSFRISFKKGQGKPSQLTKWLAGPGNWTLDTVSNLLFSIDAELDFSVSSFAKKSQIKRVGRPLPSPTDSETSRDHGRHSNASSNPVAATTVWVMKLVRAFGVACHAHFLSVDVQ